MEEMSEYKRVYCRPSGPPDTCGLVHFGRTIYGTVGIRFPSAIVSIVLLFFLIVLVFFFFFCCFGFFFFFVTGSYLFSRESTLTIPVFSPPPSSFASYY